YQDQLRGPGPPERYIAPRTRSGRGRRHERQRSRFHHHDEPQPGHVGQRLRQCERLQQLGHDEEVTPRRRDGTPRRPPSVVPALWPVSPARTVPACGGASSRPPPGRPGDDQAMAFRRAASTRGSASSISRTDTAPTLRRNQPFSPLNPKAWNGTTANPASSSKYRRTSSFVRKPRLPIKSNFTDR